MVLSISAFLMNFFDCLKFSLLYFSALMFPKITSWTGDSVNISWHVLNGTYPQSWCDIQYFSVNSSLVNSARLNSSNTSVCTLHDECIIKCKLKGLYPGNKYFFNISVTNTSNWSSPWVNTTTVLCKLNLFVYFL